MRRFSTDYLRRTRAGMWESREALADLDLGSRRRVLDAGCGTGEFTRVLDAESPGEVVGLDADPSLLRVARGETGAPVVAGDATRLPFVDDAFDLVVCQALLVNLPDPASAIREFARVSGDLVAVVEPDNGDVEVTSTVDEEPTLAGRARAAYVDGVDVDVTLGDDAADLLEDAGLVAVETARHVHRRTVEPPYAEADYEAAARKARGDRLAEQRETLLAGDLRPEAYEELRSAWREMGRNVVEQMREGRYVRGEAVPFYVTVGRVPYTDDRGSP